MTVAKRAVTLVIFISMTMLLLLNWINNQNNAFIDSVHGRRHDKGVYNYETPNSQPKSRGNRTRITDNFPETSHPEHLSDSRHVKVILLGNMRTGSSYVGEIFNQNPDFFYVFEPLHAVDKRYQVSPSEQTSTAITAKYANALRNIPKCRFSTSFVDDLSEWGLSKKMSMDVNQLCQNRRTHSCKKFTGVEARSFVVQLSRECNSRKHFATKTIRADMSLMRLLIEGDNMDFKIIQLIRDPRGVANARKNYYMASVEKLIKQGGRTDVTLNSTNLTLSDVEHSSLSVRTIKSYCKWIWHSMGWIDDKPEWLRNRYKLIRYEDFVMDPIKISQQIYDFIGVPYPQPVKSWLVDANKIVNAKQDLFQTRKKKSLQELFVWRKSLTYAEVHEVQEACGGVLQSLGYTKFNNDNDLKDDTIQTISNIKFGDNS